MLLQDMLRPSVEELVRVKDVDVQMREFLANLRVTVEAGQKGKKKKAKKKAKKKKEKKGKKKKDPTEGRSMERCASFKPFHAAFKVISFSASTANLLWPASSSPYPPHACPASKARSRTPTPRRRQGGRAMRRSR
jgi:hypothetical protein